MVDTLDYIIIALLFVCLVYCIHRLYHSYHSHIEIQKLDDELVKLENIQKGIPLCEGDMSRVKGLFYGNNMIDLYKECQSTCQIK